MAPGPCRRRDSNPYALADRGAGLLFAPKDLEVAAELLGTVVYDRAVRAGVLEGQRRRLRDFAPARIEQRLRETLETVL